jgi:predicted dehydrogenase
MLQIGIIGPATAIQRHTIALHRLQGVRVADQWITERDKESVMHAETGVLCMIPAKIIGTSDAIIIAAPGNFGMQLAVAALRAARHVYLYPSAISMVTEASYLIKLAREANVILMAGKTGNDNTRDVLKHIPDIAEAGMIELQHDLQGFGQYNNRSIYDTLLGDMEIVHSLTRGRVISVKVKGMCMVGEDPDIISGRLDFDNGCTVNITCNLVAAHNSFTGMIVLKNRILKYDFLTGEGITWPVYPSGTSVSPVRLRFEKSDPLVSELSDFIDVVRSGAAFLMMHDNGFEPYMLTDRILEKVMKTLVRC